MSGDAREAWDERWPDSRTWDQFTELVSTMCDDVMPTLVQPDTDFMRNLAASVVLWLCTDAEMRALALDLFDASEPQGLAPALDLTDEGVDEVVDSENVILMRELIYKLWSRLKCAALSGESPT